MKRDEYLLEQSDKHIEENLIDGWNEQQSDMMTNADRQAYRDEVVGASFDANSIEDADFDKMVDVPVYDQYERVIGMKTVIKKKR